LKRAGEQNAARVGQLQTLAPENANPGAVRDFLQQRLAQLDAEGDANVAAARQNTQQAFDMAAGRLSRDDLGTLMRDQLEAAKRPGSYSRSAANRPGDLRCGCGCSVSRCDRCNPKPGADIQQSRGRACSG
jgi:hypothetical protein